MKNIEIGTQAGYLTVTSEPTVKIKFDGKRKRKQKYCECKCVCGETVIRSYFTLKHTTHTHSCGCKNKIDLTPGNVINGFEVVKEVESHIQPDGSIVRKAELLCKECSNPFITSVYILTRTDKRLKSCGCLKPVLVNKPKKNIIYHGHSSKKTKTVEYVAWNSMKQRCYNPNNIRYSSYGGRGIIVCDRWRESYLNFFEDMGKRPSDIHSIDRINVDGNYEPNNCRWALPDVQQANKRSQKNQKRVNISIGNRFGKLVVIDNYEPYISKTGKSFRRFKVKCDCGGEIISYLTELTLGKKMACPECNGYRKKKTPIPGEKLIV